MPSATTDGWSSEYVRETARRSFLFEHHQDGNASTLQVVNVGPHGLKPHARRRPMGLQINELFRPSGFGNKRRGRPARSAIAAGLTALISCLYFGSWLSPVVGHGSRFALPLLTRITPRADALRVSRRHANR